MGASISTATSNIRTTTSNTEFISIERNRIPKHLQPLKGRSVEKHSARSSSEKQSLAHQEKDVDKSNRQQTLIANNASTLIPHQNLGRLNELEQTFFDHATSGPQMFRWTKGRRFQNIDNLPYPLPNDQSEIDRHRVQFYVIRWAFDSRHIVPPSVKQKLLEGIQVLNVGCGPGLWSGHPIIDMAEDFRRSTFNAVDICNLTSQPHEWQSSNTQYQSTDGYQGGPDNLKFTLHNVLSGPLPFESDKFDYVQQSITALTYKAEDWHTVLNEIKRVTKPGGYIQLIESELYPHCLGPMGELWRDHILDVIKSKRGNDPRIAIRFEELLSSIDLEDVTVKFVSIPIGSWGLDIGNLWKQNFYAFLESAATFLVDLMEITNSDYKKETQKLTEELDSGDYKAFSNIYVAYGRKKKASVSE